MNTDSDYCSVCQYPLMVEAAGACTNCLSKEQETVAYRASAVRRMGGEKIYVEYTKEAFNVRPNNLEAYKAASEFDPTKESLYIYGPRGAGKSHLAAIAKRAYAGSDSLVTVSMPYVLDEIKASVKDGRYTSAAKEWLRILSTSPVLSVEDLGVEKPSEFCVEFYWKWVDQRYRDMRHGLIVTSNLSLEDLEHTWARFDPHGRVVSRLEGMCVVRSLLGERDRRKNR